MKSTVSSKVLHPIIGIEQAREIITEYIGENLRNIDICGRGRNLHAEISYIDFKPERDVRRHIEDAIPNIYIDNLYREYSDENITDALVESDITIYVQEEDGCLRPTTPYNLIYEIMQHIDYTKDSTDTEKQQEQ